MAKQYKLELKRGYPQDTHHRAGLLLQRGGTLITELSKDQLEAVKNDAYIELSEAKQSDKTKAAPVSEGAGVETNAVVGADQPDRTASEDAEVVEDQSAESEEATGSEDQGSDEEEVTTQDAPAETVADEVATEDAAEAETAQESVENTSGEEAEDTVDSLCRDNDRPSLNALAVAAGVEAPEALDNKQAVAQAILDTRKES